MEKIYGILNMYCTGVVVCCVLCAVLCCVLCLCTVFCTGYAVGDTPDKLV